MGTLSLGFAEKLIMGIGPRSALIAGLVSAGAGLLLFTQAPGGRELGGPPPAR